MNDGYFFTRNNCIKLVLPFVRRTAIAHSSSWNQRETRLEWRSIYSCFSSSWDPLARPSEWRADLVTYVLHWSQHSRGSVICAVSKHKRAPEERVLFHGHPKQTPDCSNPTRKTTASLKTFLVRTYPPCVRARIPTKTNNLLKLYKGKVRMKRDFGGYSRSSGSHLTE